MAAERVLLAALCALAALTAATATAPAPEGDVDGGDASFTAASWPSGSPGHSGRAGTNAGGLHTFGADVAGPMTKLVPVQSDEDVLRVTLVVDIFEVPGFNASSYATGPAGTGSDVAVGGVEQEVTSIENNATVLFDTTTEVKAYRTRMYNGTIPGPTIAVFPGQVLELTIVNRLGPDNEYFNCCSEEALVEFEQGGPPVDGFVNNTFGCYPGVYSSTYFTSESGEPASFMTGSQWYGGAPPCAAAPQRPSAPPLTCPWRSAPPTRSCNNCTAGPPPEKMNFMFYGPNTTNFHTVRSRPPRCPPSPAPFHRCV